MIPFGSGRYRCPTEKASRVTGIPTIDELARQSMENILDF